MGIKLFEHWEISPDPIGFAGSVPVLELQRIDARGNIFEILEHKNSLESLSRKTENSIVAYRHETFERPGDVWLTVSGESKKRGDAGTMFTSPDEVAAVLDTREVKNLIATNWPEVDQKLSEITNLRELSAGELSDVFFAECNQNVIETVGFAIQQKIRRKFLKKWQPRDIVAYPDDLLLHAREIIPPIPPHQFEGAVMRFHTDHSDGYEVLRWGEDGHLYYLDAF